MKKKNSTQHAATSSGRVGAALAICILSAIRAVGADAGNVTQVDWDTRTASCPAKVTQSTNVTIRVTDINDLLIDFSSGDTPQYQLRAKGTPMSAVPPENPFVSQIGLGAEKFRARTANCQEAQLRADLTAVRGIKNEKIAPSKPGGPYIDWRTTLGAAQLEDSVAQVVTDMASTDSQCVAFFQTNSNDPVVRWINKLNATSNTSSGAPAHSIDFNVNLEPNQNYEFKLQESWKGKVIDGGTMRWNCGENDILSISVGPLITTLPYRTYNQQQVPTATGTQNELVVSGTTNVNVLGAALINVHPPSIPGFPGWTGFAFSVGPVYTLGNAPSISKLGLFVGGSLHLYRSLFLTPGVHIGEFADFPAGFKPGSVIPSGFGTLTPVTRNTAHFAVGITFKTTSFKKSSQNTGAATNPGTTPATQRQPTSGNQPHVQPGSGGTGTGGGTPSPQPQPASGNQNAPTQPAQPPPTSPSPQKPDSPLP